MRALEIWMHESTLHTNSRTWCSYSTRSLEPIFMCAPIIPCSSSELSICGAYSLWNVVHYFCPSQHFGSFVSLPYGEAHSEIPENWTRLRARRWQTQSYFVYMLSNCVRCCPFYPRCRWSVRALTASLNSKKSLNWAHVSRIAAFSLE